MWQCQLFGLALRNPKMFKEQIMLCGSKFKVVSRTLELVELRLRVQRASEVQNSLPDSIKFSPWSYAPLSTVGRSL